VHERTGGSSLIGALTENGPFYLDDTSFTDPSYNKTGVPKLHRRPDTWAKMANMVFVETPAMTGFSYCDNDCAWNDDTTADAHYQVRDCARVDQLTVCICTSAPHACHGLVAVVAQASPLTKSAIFIDNVVALYFLLASFYPLRRPSISLSFFAPFYNEHNPLHVC
jgi:hypothetical protein